MTTPPENEPTLPLTALLESILFVAPEPVSIATLATSLDATAEQVQTAVKELAESYKGRGLQVLRVGNRLHLTSSSLSAKAVEKYLGMDHTTGLSRAALETLAIVSYRQPLTRPQVDAIRGVNSDSVIDSLIAKGLVEETGRTEGPGRPILYGTTPAFMHHFGLGSMEELPPLQLEEPAAETPAESVAHITEEVLKG
jgi:segregation and condensation protein B